MTLDTLIPASLVPCNGEVTWPPVEPTVSPTHAEAGRRDTLSWVWPGILFAHVQVPSSSGKVGCTGDRRANLTIFGSHVRMVGFIL